MQPTRKRKASTQIGRKPKRQVIQIKTPTDVQMIDRPLGFRPKKALTESKHVDLAAATYGFDTTGSIALLHTIAQGNDNNQRIGRQVKLFRLWMRGIAQAKTATTTALCRLIIVYDKETVKALPLVTDVLESANAKAHKNDDNKKRFKFLYDETFVMAGNTTTPATGLEAKAIAESIPLGFREVDFAALGTGAIADIIKGGLYVVTVGDTVSGTAACNASIGFRVYFTDR